MNARTKLTREKQAEFLEIVAKTVNVTFAAEQLGLSREALYVLRRQDEQFDEAWDAAVKIGVAALEDEVHRRAFHGVNEPVFYKGVEVAKVRKYSDTLAIFLLKAHCPDKYRERIENLGPGGGPLTVQIVRYGEASDSEPVAAKEIPASPLELPTRRR